MLRSETLRRPNQLDRLDRKPAWFGQRRDVCPVLRPSRTFRQCHSAARPRILHTAATAGMRGLRIESWCELHALGGCGHSMPTRRTSELAVGVLSWRSSRELGRSRVQWRARGYLGHQVVVLAHSEQDCALVGLCLSTFTSRQLHISPPPPVLSPGQQPTTGGHTTRVV